MLFRTLTGPGKVIVSLSYFYLRMFVLLYLDSENFKQVGCKVQVQPDIDNLVG